MLPGLENYLSDERTGYAVLAVGPQYPHACTSFEYPARYTVPIKGNPDRSLLFVVLRGRDRAEDISWRVYVNEVKVSRIFKPQHYLRTRSDLYYVYIADVSPITRSIGTTELLVKCHARDTYIESAGLVTLLPNEHQSRVSVHIGVSRIEGELGLRLGEQGFSVVSMTGRGEGGTIVTSGVPRRVNGVFELSELLLDNQVGIRGPVNVYAVVTNTYTGKPPDICTSGVSVEPERIKLVLTNPGDYGIGGIDLRLLRGTQAVGKLTIKQIGPRESVELTLDKPAPLVNSIKVTYEFAGHAFTRVLPLNPT